MNKLILQILNMSKKEAEKMLESLLVSMTNNKEIEVFNSLKDAYDKELTEEQMQRVTTALLCYIKIRSMD